MPGTAFQGCLCAVWLRYDALVATGQVAQIECDRTHLPFFLSAKRFKGIRVVVLKQVNLVKATSLRQAFSSRLNRNCLYIKRMSREL